MGSHVIQVLSTLRSRERSSFFFPSARASRGQRKSDIRDGARVSRERGSCVLLWFKRKIKDYLQSNIVVDSQGRAWARARKLRAQSKKPRARSIQPKFQPVRPGKVIHLKRWTRFFETFPVGPNRSIEFWTEISGNFGWMDRAPRYFEGSRAKMVEQNDRRSVRLKNSHPIVTAVYRPPAHDLTSRLYKLSSIHSIDISFFFPWRWDLLQCCKLYSR